MFNVGSVQGYLKLNTTGWNTAMGRANASLASLSRTMTKFGALTTGSLLLIEREFGKFDKAIRHATSVSETTEEQFKQMSKMALDVSVQWNKAAADTAQAFYYLGSAGLTVTEQMQAFNDTIMLSRAMGSELSQTVEGLVDIVRAFGLEFANTKNIADQLTQTVISSNQHFADLDKALSYAGATAAFTNNTLAETNAMLGVMANAGIKGSMAGTVLRRALANLVSPTTQMASLLYKLGMNVYDSSGKMKPFIQIIGEMGDKMQGTSEAYRNMVFKILFGVRAIGGQIQLFNYGADALRKYANEIQNATGATERVAGKQMKAFIEVLGRLWREIQRVAIELGEKLAPAFERVANSIRDKLSVFRSYIEVNHDVILELMKWTTATAALALVIPVVVGLASALLSLVNPFTVLLGALYLYRMTWSDTFKENGELHESLKEFTTVLEKWVKEQLGILAPIMKILWRGVSIPLKVPMALWESRKSLTDMYKEFGFQIGLTDTDPAANKATKDLTKFSEVIEKGADAAKNLGKVAAEVAKEDIAKLSGGLINLLPSDLQKRLEALVESLKGLHTLFMKEPDPFFRNMRDWLEGFDKKMAESATKWRSQFDGMGRAFGKTMGVIETAWAEARQAIFSPVEGTVRDWGDMFIDVLTAIQSGWQSTFSNILNDTYDKARTIENVLEDMFLNILHQFNNLLAEIAARSLLDAMFKGKMERQAGTPTFGDIRDMLFPKNTYHTPGLSTPPLSQPQGEWAPSTPQLGFQSGKIAINNNIINNTDTRISARKSTPQWNGRQWAINTVLEAYDTDPYVRNKLRGR